MNDPSAVLDRPTAADVCGCFADAPPLPMGCAACGHAPYAHGCPGQASDHDYAQPSGELMAERLWVRRELSLGRALPTFEPAREVTAQPTLVPAPRQAGPEATPSRTRPVERTDTRRPVTPSRPRQYRPVEAREDRAARLALARDPRTRRRARTAAATQERTPYRVEIGADLGNHFHRSNRPPWSEGNEARRLQPGELAVQRIRVQPPDIPEFVDWHRPYRTRVAA